MTKKITFTIDELVIKRARQIARARKTTLNAVLRQWLEEYVCQSERLLEFDALMERLKHVKAYA